jgi:hypothetical protein
VTIEKICGGMKRVSPISRRKTGLEQKRPHDVVHGAKSAFGTSVLLGGIWARHPKDDPVSEEERAGRGVVKLAAVVALNCLDGGGKLRAHIGEKVREDAKSIRFKAQRKSPGVVSAIIKNDQIIFISRHTDNWRGPKITMY